MANKVIESIADGLRAYFKTCPLIERGKINLNYLGEGKTDYAIIESPDSPIIQSYMHGASLRQKSFALASTTHYGADIANNVANSVFFEKFGRWVEKQNRSRIFPVLPDGLVAQGMKITASGFVFQAEGTTAQMQIQGQLIYYDKGEN